MADVALGGGVKGRLNNKSGSFNSGGVGVGIGGTYGGGAVFGKEYGEILLIQCVLTPDCPCDKRQDYED